MSILKRYSNLERLEYVPGIGPAPFFIAESLDREIYIYSFDIHVLTKSQWIEIGFLLCKRINLSVHATENFIDFHVVLREIFNCVK